MMASYKYSSVEQFKTERMIGRGQFSSVYRARGPAGEPVALKRVQLLDMVDDKARQDCLKEVDLLQTERMIGRGQFSSVYRARGPAGEPVALKRVQLLDMVDDKARQDCLKEVDLLQQMEHPNIIKYLASFTMHHASGDELIIVLECAEAGDLARMVRHFRRHRRLIPERAVWRYFSQVAAAVAHMHSKRIMHRDIKPANVFLTAEGIVKLGDLGLGRYFSGQTLAAHSMVGTPYYMSPERIHQCGYSFTSDVWSLGCLLYEMAALQSPFYGDHMNLYTLCKKIERCDYAPIPSRIYSLQMQDLIKECINADPAQRPDVEKVLRVSQEMYQRYATPSQPPSCVSIRRPIPTPAPLSRPRWSFS